MSTWLGCGCFVIGVSNLSQVAGQKQTLQVMASRTNFPTTIPFPLLLLKS